MGEKEREERRMRRKKEGKARKNGKKLGWLPLIESALFRGGLEIIIKTEARM